MTALVALIVIACGITVAAYKAGARSPAVAIVLASLLASAAWYLLFVWKFSFGEGAAAGVAVIPAGVRSLGVLCLVWAATMLFASHRHQASVPARLFLILLVSPLALAFAYRLIRPSSDGREPATAPRRGQTSPERASYAEGYAWAIDNGVVSPSDCAGGSAAFLEGCKQGALRNHPDSAAR